MPDDDYPNGEERRSSMTTRTQRPIGAVVRDPHSTKTNPSLMRFVISKIGETLTVLFVTLGIMRPRNPDGTLGKRSWKRLGTTIAVTIGIVFVWTSVHIVKPGTVGVPVTLGHAEKPLSAGLHITLPLTTVYSMNIRTQSYTMSALKGDGNRANIDDSVAVLGADGGAANVNATLLYRLDRSQATNVYKTLGRNYSTAIVRPTARECIRTTFTRYPIVQDSTTAWGQLETAVALCMKTRIEPQGLTLQEFQLREVTLDPKLQAAVTSKISSQQNAEQQQFELSTAEQAADITRIQALATADSQQILACGGVAKEVKEADGTTRQSVVPNPISSCTQAQLTPQYLQFSYIQALKQLVNSPNNSTIILPFDKNLTPLLQVPSGSSSGNASTSPGTNGNATVTGG
jgi:regulator of protease activity HflC (stomatin/prohibitin superfamily)